MSTCARALVFTGLLSLSACAAAFDDQSNGIYVEAGRAPHGDTGTNAMEVGLVTPWAYGPSVLGGPLSFYGDFFLSQWRAPQASGPGHHGYTQIGAIANWRWRLDDGASPWFAEAGIGATVLDGIYRTPHRQFSTAFQFTEQIGIGRNFGARGQHELSLRLQHFSNADIKRPNPGENFLRVRYLYRF
ncbi:Lipid A 3-O-deacylase (PagL) [Variovorax sp. SRS16]|uniref:acyloxyacyl hydrolase n=1 Tax=Variovorax sp. SRS16 TaxID=282217 RepID=UPI001318B40D|nr:acyloxyacyl hydrolase [Variovorax sp. SRS16]VTU14275.1 Lipid A 3-O-deacylase (PagL) [Variovorax sp. SRS16]